MSKLDIIIAVDPGVSGAVGVLIGDSGIVFDTPIIKTSSKVKGVIKYKTHYDLLGMVSLFKPFRDSNAILVLEDVSAMPGEGVTSSFNFGEGKGIWLGILSAIFEKSIVMVRASTWKKTFPEITDRPDIRKLKEESKALSAKYKVMKDNKKAKEIKKEISSIGRSVKYIAKSAARELAMTLFPDIKDKFVLKKHDGRAEALLIATYARRNCK